MLLQTDIFVYKVKPLAGIAGNECADAVVKHQANQANSSITDTGILSAGHSRNPFSQVLWSAKEEKESILPAHPMESTAPAPNPKITYLQNALKSHMHTNHRLGYAAH
eukprot:1155574-Pelagomonas_calceolata.AAC.4